MSSHGVVLTIEHQLHLQLLKRFLLTCPGFELVGESSDPLTAMALIVQKKPAIWMHSWEEGPELQAFLSHVYACTPEIAVVRISPNESAAFLQVQISSLDGLLNLAGQQKLIKQTV